VNYPLIHPGTATLGQQFADSRIILVKDHMPHPLCVLMSKNGNQCYIKNTILDLFSQASIDIKQKTFVLDSYMCLDDIPDAVFTNKFLIDTADSFSNILPDWKLPNSIPTKKLSAMMNKMRPNRILLSMLLSNLFNLNEIEYSSTDYSNSNDWLTELLILTDYNNYNKTLLPKRWVDPNYNIKSQALHFKMTLYPEIFKSAAVSLLTEPTFYELGCHISEKTVMAIYSGHMMIWVGGWKSAEMAAKLGLDVFEDVIDHSYQYIEHPTKRSIEAVLRNLDLLNNLDYQIELKQRFSKRFDDNLKLIRDIKKIEQMTRNHLNDPAKYDYIKSILQ
jgi:hypothetical protein